MARPTRCRRICAEPECRSFAPQPEVRPDTVVLTVDEFEVIRLVDYEKRTHGQCAVQMEISRTTVTEMYESARFKLSDSLVNGKPLVIAGGHYRVCQGDRDRGCGRRCRWVLAAKEGERTMRIAVPYEDGQVFQHFGHTSHVKVYDVEDGKTVKEQVADTAGHGHGALAGFLSGLGVDVLICGGIGGGAQEALAQAGIKLYGGVTGGADDAVQAFLAGTLAYDANVQCGHHGHEHHCHEHHGHEHHEHEHHGRHGVCGEDRHGCAGNGGKCGT